MATITVIRSEKTFMHQAKFEHATMRRVVPKIKGRGFCFCVNPRDYWNLYYELYG